jgi:hypothetical protein
VTGAVFFALAVIVGVGSTILAWSQVRRAAAPTKGDPATLATTLQRLPAETRLRELLCRAEPGSWEHALAAEALHAPDDSAQVAIVNLALAEVEHELSERAGWPQVSVRIALLGAALLAFGARLADQDQSSWSLAIGAVGGIAALSCMEARRSADRHAAKQRRAIDDLVAVTFGDGLKAAGVATRRAPERRARWRARRGK